MELVKSSSNESVEFLGEEISDMSKVDDQYFKVSENVEFEMIPIDVPKCEHSQVAIVNGFYNVLITASRIPEFAESANGLLQLCTEGKITIYTYENIMIAIASTISINPSFTWWLLVNGGVIASNFFFLLLEFSVMNPTKVIALYAFSRKLSALMRLYRASVALV